MSDVEKIGKVDVTVVLRVSGAGGGLYLYLPKDLARTFGILAGDRLKVHIQNHYRPKTEERSE